MTVALWFARATRARPAAAAAAAAVAAAAAPPLRVYKCECALYSINKHTTNKVCTVYKLTFLGSDI